MATIVTDIVTEQDVLDEATAYIEDHIIYAEDLIDNYKPSIEPLSAKLQQPDITRAEEAYLTAQKQSYETIVTEQEQLLVILKESLQLTQLRNVEGDIGERLIDWYNGGTTAEFVSIVKNDVSWLYKSIRGNDLGEDYYPPGIWSELFGVFPWLKAFVEQEMPHYEILKQDDGELQLIHKKPLDSELQEECLAYQKGYNDVVEESDGMDEKQHSREKDVQGKYDGEESISGGVEL